MSVIDREVTADEYAELRYAWWVLRSPMVNLDLAAAQEIDKHVKSRLIDYDENGDGLCRLCDYTHHTIVPLEWREALRILEAQ